MKQESIFYIIIIIAVVVVAALALTGLVSNWKTGANSTKPTNMVKITASGSASNEPSQALIYVTINGTGATTGSAVQNLSSTINEFNSSIYKFVNGNLSAVTTSSYSVNRPYCYQYAPYNKTSCYNGYVAEESLSIMIPNIRNVSAVLGSTASIPNVYVTYVSAALSDSQATTLRQQALESAIANATSQAGAVIGPNDMIYSTNVTVNSYYAYPYPYGVSATASANGGTASVAPSAIGPQFYGGTNQVEESVSVVFYYGPK